MTDFEIQQIIMRLTAIETGLGLNQIKPSDSFADLGIDSIRAIYLLDLLEKETQLSINPYWLWEYPTICQLSAHLSKILK